MGILDGIVEWIAEQIMAGLGPLATFGCQYRFWARLVVT